MFGPNIPDRAFNLLFWLAITGMVTLATAVGFIGYHMIRALIAYMGAS